MMTEYVIFKMIDPRAMGLGLGIESGSIWVATQHPNRSRYCVAYEDHSFPIYDSDVASGFVEIVG